MPSTDVRPTVKPQWGERPDLPPTSEASVRRHLSWLGGGLLASFLVPFIVADQLAVQRDVYIGIYAAAVVGLCAGWATDTKQSIPEMCARRWRLAAGLGVLFAGLMAAIVFATEDASEHPGGLEFIGALVWRGGVYGVADGLLLSAFPILVVSAALAHSRVRERGGVAAVGVLALLASLTITATYHLGYGDFRSAKVRQPLAGDLVWSVPTLVTLNPIGAPIAHVGLHVAAVIHSYDTDLFLPPHE